MDRSVTAVLRLFLLRRPTAIAWLVIAVVIEPVNRMFWRRLAPHISKEIGEIAPTVANRNSARAVVFITDRLGVAAPPSHFKPSVPLWCLMGFAVLALALGGHFAVEASARLDELSPQIAGGGKFLCSAVAAAKPAFSANKSEGSQPVETLARFDEAWHG